MPKSKIILSIGVVIALLPVLGFPHSWEAFFQVLSGLAIVVLSIWANIDRKLKLQAKAQQRASRKITPEASLAQESSEANQVNESLKPEFGKRVTDFYPKTGQPGRRLTDLKPTIEPPREEENIDLQ